MKRAVMAAMVALLACAASFAQSMMNSGTSAGDAGSMSAPTTADPRVGAELRAAKSTGRKVIFTDLAAAQALAAKGVTVLFFAADGDPGSQQDMRDINVNGSQLKDITIVVVDFDKEKAVKKQLGVTVQDTFVQVDAAGAKVAAWNGGGVAAVLKRVKRS